MSLVGRINTIMEGNLSEACEDADTNGRALLGDFLRDDARLQNLDPKIAELVTFKGCPEILRGSDLATVMQRGAEIFRDSVGSAATYKLSKKVERLYAFISHNWSVPRRQKFLALSLVFNFNIACVCSATVALFPIIDFMFLDLSGKKQESGSKKEPSRGVLYTVVFVPAFLLFMFFVRDVQQYLGLRSSPVFLDKTCIHQEDKEVQRRGIEKLGAFLHYSDRMVVLYTDVYLRKLWTVYEVASFLAIHPVRRMEVMPISKANTFFTCTIALWAIDIVAWLVWAYVPALKTFPRISVRFLVYVPAGPLYMMRLRQWAREETEIKKELNWFKVEKCLCFDKRDKPVVYANIAALMRATKSVPPTAGESYCLEAFDMLVREQLPRAFVASKRRAGYSTFSYAHALFFSVVVLVPATLDDGPMGGTRLPCQFVLIWHFMFSAVPLTFLLIEVLATSFIDLWGTHQWAYLQMSLVFAVFVPLFIILWCVLTLYQACECEKCGEEATPLGFSNYYSAIGFIVSAPVMHLFTYLLYTDRRLYKCRQRCSILFKKTNQTPNDMPDTEVEMVGNASSRSAVFSTDSYRRAISSAPVDETVSPATVNEQASSADTGP